MALIGTLTSGVSALKTFTKDLEVIGNNIANVNTTAYKASKVAISQDFSNTLRASQPSGGQLSNIQAAQIGTGVKVTGIDVRYTQGALSTTGGPTDLGISGKGFFRVRSVADNLQYATRVGSFRWDDQGYLVTSQGLRVQGLTVAAATVGAAPTFTAVGDVRRSGSGAGQVATPTAGVPPVTLSVQSISIDRSGQVVEFYNDGTSAVLGQILTQDFAQPGSLMQKGDGLYTSLEYAGPVGGVDMTLANNTGANSVNFAGRNGLGTIESGTLELSNVDLTEEFANMITAQRSFQAASRVVTLSDSVLEEIVNLKR